jgi:hypothetical protein
MSSPVTHFPQVGFRCCSNLVCALFPELAVDAWNAMCRTRRKTNVLDDRIALVHLAHMAAKKIGKRNAAKTKAQTKKGKGKSKAAGVKAKATGLKAKAVGKGKKKVGAKKSTAKAAGTATTKKRKTTRPRKNISEGLEVSV